MLFRNYEKEVKKDGMVRHLNYVSANGRLVAIFEQTDGEIYPHYVYTDYPGSLRCITDDSGYLGNVEQNMSYDAWGNRRDPVTGIPYNELVGADLQSVPFSH